MDNEETITTEDIEKLRTEAGENGDTMQVAVCDLALIGFVEPHTLDQLDSTDCEALFAMGREKARAQCEKVIREAAAEWAAHYREQQRNRP